MFGVGDDGASDASIFVVVVVVVVVVSSVNAFFFEPVFGSFFSSSSMSFGEEGSVLKVVFFFFLVVVLSPPPKGSDVDDIAASSRNFLFRSLSLLLRLTKIYLSRSIDRSIWIVLEHTWCSRMSNWSKELLKEDEEENSLSPIPHKNPN